MAPNHTFKYVLFNRVNSSYNVFRAVQMLAMAHQDHRTETRLQNPDKAINPRAEVTDMPEFCGFGNHTATARCSNGFACKFNTDLYVIGCCSDDVCAWRTSCCDYNPSLSRVA